MNGMDILNNPLFKKKKAAWDKALPKIKDTENKKAIWEWATKKEEEASLEFWKAKNLMEKLDREETIATEKRENLSGEYWKEHDERQLIEAGIIKERKRPKIETPEAKEKREVADKKSQEAWEKHIAQVEVTRQKKAVWLWARAEEKRAKKEYLDARNISEKLEEEYSVIENEWNDFNGKLSPWEDFNENPKQGKDTVLEHRDQKNA